MKFADLMLRMLLRQRDRDAISGDLMEEYREEILPSKGRWRARFWYVGQIISFISPAAWGLVIGIVAGALLLIDTAIEPLADDTGGAMLVIVSVLLVLFAAVAYGAARRSLRFRDALTAGALVGVTTLAIANVAAIVRVNVFLEEIRDRADWANLVARFQASDFQSLRAYANYEYFSGTFFVVLMGAIMGILAGTVGGALTRIVRPKSLT